MLRSRRRCPPGVLLLALLAAGLAPAGLTKAHAASGTDDRIQELQAQIGEASAEEGAALAELDAVRSRRATLDAEIRSLDAEIASASGRAGAARQEVDRLAARYVGLEARLDATDRRLRDARGRFDETVAALYRSGGSPAPAYAALVLDTSAPHELLAGTRYLEDVSRTRYATVEELAGLRERTARLRARAEHQKDRAERARAAADTEQADLTRLRAEQDEKRGAVAAEERREQDLVTGIRARKDAYTRELAVLQAASNAIAGDLQGRQGGQARTGFRVAVRPVPGAVTSGFGPRVHPILGTTRMHTGVDMSAGYGTPIRAAAGGVIAWAGPRSGYGNTVIIDHGNQYATLYAHMSSFSVVDGEPVEAGEQVGAVGATGLATGPHLHFEVRLLGVPQNPLDYL